MEEGLWSFEMPVPPETLALVEGIVRESNVLTFFDSSIDPAEAIRYRFEKAQYDTDTFALLDLNCFKDILSLGRADRSRSDQRRKQAAALCLFFQCADISVEPGFALHESPGNAAEELGLFRTIDNLDPIDLANVATGKVERIPSDRFSDVRPIEPNGNLFRDLRGTLGIEIGLLKLALLLREKCSPFERLESFLRWSLDEFLFLREPTILAFHQLTGNLPKPILRDVHSPNPANRRAGIKNAMWDLLLLRDWRYKLETQATEQCLWLLCSRDTTVVQLARKLVVVGDDDELEREHRKQLLSNLWGELRARKILDLYDQCVRQVDSSERKVVQADGKLNWEEIRDELRGKLQE